MQLGILTKMANNRGREGRIFMNVLITGTSKGIGLELTKKALAEDHNVFAVARSIQSSPELKELELASKGKLHLIEVDLMDDDAILEILSKIKLLSHLDVLINNAGVYQEDYKIEDFLNSFRINSVVPFFLMKELLPLLKKSSDPKVINISSQMGSITDNTSGGSHAYRSSKAALNMMVKGLSVSEKWLKLAVFHPGWVKTRMGGENAPVDVKDSANGIWKLMMSLTSAQSGSFLDYQGKELPW